MYIVTHTLTGTCDIILFTKNVLHLIFIYLCPLQLMYIKHYIVTIHHQAAKLDNFDLRNSKIQERTDRHSLLFGGQRDLHFSISYIFLLRTSKRERERERERERVNERDLYHILT